MFMSLISHVLSAWFAFLLPCYSTFKALSHRPLSEPELQRWSMYWCVIGTFVAFEYLAEWLISWLPFYWEIKTLFLLFLALPQTQGSTFIYTTYLQPFFVQNEADLDAGIISMQSNALSFVQGRLQNLWNFALGIINNQSNQQHHAPTSGHSTGGSAPTVSWQSAFGLWQTYGPSMLNSLQSRASETSNAASTSSTSLNANIGERHFPRTPDYAPSMPNPYDVTPGSRASDTPPSFPVPKYT
ncbi:TB2/DP1, HVA22 family-domain-containing protein [Crucibulum laeve]|uniref:Protein YOP1 n=1 Tax=Crucibulum laeve TaxID=68775 RepID=A0A5C3LVX8_9AGAR|nr:TB2/DP1, HVA22 family-domain-containing protein [Crucibulum laeve]